MKVKFTTRFCNHTGLHFDRQRFPEGTVYRFWLFGVFIKLKLIYIDTKLSPSTQQWLKEYYEERRATRRSH